MWIYIAGGVILVTLILVALRARDGGGRDLVAGDPVRQRVVVDPPSEARVIELARSNRKIQAIKMLREMRPMSLKEAKDWVDAVSAGHSGPTMPPGVAGAASMGMPPGRVAGAPGMGVPAGRAVGAPSDEEILDVARRGNKIAAIKMAREAYGWGLREAKDWVEAHA